MHPASVAKYNGKLCIYISSKTDQFPVSSIKIQVYIHFDLDEKAGKLADMEIPSSPVLFFSCIFYRISFWIFFYSQINQLGKRSLCVRFTPWKTLHKSIAFLKLSLQLTGSIPEILFSMYIIKISPRVPRSTCVVKSDLLTNDDYLVKGEFEHSIDKF